MFVGASGASLIVGVVICCPGSIVGSTSISPYEQSLAGRVVDPLPMHTSNCLQGGPSSVLRSGSVWFFDPKGGNQQPQLVATVPQLTGTATELVQPVPIGLVVSKRPV